MSAPARTRITDEDKAEARTRIREAFAMAGLVSGGKYVCPACQRVHSKKNTLSVRDKGTWKCFSSDMGGDAISLVQETFGYSFPQAVNALLGRPVDGEAPPKPKVRDLPPVQETRPESTIDPEVYQAVLEFSGQEGRQAAADYYGYWHISADAVFESGASVVLDTAAMEKAMIERFGIQRLHDCGLVVKTRKGKDYFLVNRDYPVIEPHITPRGFVVGMQFRPSVKQREKVEAHKRWVAAQARGDSTVPEAKYVPKFMSLSGIDANQSLIGFGLGRLWQAPPDTIVEVVEGFKDYLAARTMGHEAFGIPGTSAVLSDNVLNLLKRHRISVALDGDKAGVQAQAKWVEQLRERGVRARGKRMPVDADVADILVKKHADTGCTCEVCTAWRNSHPSGAAA